MRGEREDVLEKELEARGLQLVCALCISRVRYRIVCTANWHLQLVPGRLAFAASMSSAFRASGAGTLVSIVCTSGAIGSSNRADWR